MQPSSTITLPDRFDYSHYQRFSEQQSILIASDTTEIYLDFSRVEYLDSSALGMMVVFQRKAAAVNKKILIKGARGYTEEILRMANMNKIFEFCR